MGGGLSHMSRDYSNSYEETPSGIILKEEVMDLKENRR